MNNNKLIERNLNEYGIIFSYESQYERFNYETYYIRYKNSLDPTFMKGISNLFFLCGNQCFFRKKLKNIVSDKIELGVTFEKSI